MFFNNQPRVPTPPFWLAMVNLLMVLSFCEARIEMGDAEQVICSPSPWAQPASSSDCGWTL